MMNTPEIVNVQIKGINKGKPKLKADGCILPFYQTKKSLRDLETYNKFIKNVESLVRGSKEYRKYKDYLMNDIGLNYCMVFPNISTEMGDVTIEMHHGPILTLYDYCCIVTDHYLENDIPVSSFRIAEAVLQEHDNNNVQIVMLCDLAHKLFHAQQVYINPKQAWGNINNFLEKYKDGVGERMSTIINRNIELGEKYHSFDRDGILEANKPERWDKED